MIGRLLCLLFDHDLPDKARMRWHWCRRCKRNIYTGGARGR